MGLGCWVFGEDSYWGHQNHRDSVKTLQAALRGGIKHFDTARSYGNGRSEQITGQQLRKEREKVVIATKSTWLPADSVAKYVDISLGRLCTDYIDIFYIHWPNSGKDFRPMFEGLEKIRQTGKIRYIGVSNFSIPEMDLLKSSGQIDYCQAGYSLLWRFPEREIFPYCVENGIKIVSYSSLAQGILTDRFNIELKFPSGDPRGRLVFFHEDSYRYISEFLKKFKFLADKEGVKISQLALYWALSRPGVYTVLAGARTREQLEENLLSTKLNINSDLLNEVTELSDSICNNIPIRNNIFNHVT